MKILTVHPSGLAYAKIYLRLEPVGLELVAQALRRAGHQVKLIDLQVEKPKAYLDALKTWQPEVVAFSVNYMPNIPEVVDMARTAKEILPGVFVFAGGHSASFMADEILEHARGNIDCVLQGEGEVGAVQLMEIVLQETDPGNRRKALVESPGVVSEYGRGPAPLTISSLDDLRPARDLLRYPNKYFVAFLDPAASIEFSRGCPWDCNFCSAWTFYGRSYRTKDPEQIAEELQSIRQPGVFILDDVAFLQEKHAYAIGEAIARRGIKKKYYLETRCDVLLRNQEVFKFWKKLGLEYVFLGLEAIDAEGLDKLRKRVSPEMSFEALQVGTAMGLIIAVNIIIDPSWDRDRFQVLREWSKGIHELVNLSVLTPYPGTETWLNTAHRFTTRDYRLFDLQHCALETRLPLADFYQEMMKTYWDFYLKIIEWKEMLSFIPEAAGYLLRGKTNFLKIMYNYGRLYTPERLLADHAKPVRYELHLPAPVTGRLDPKSLYIHPVQGRGGRNLDTASEAWVQSTSQKKRP